MTARIFECSIFSGLTVVPRAVQIKAWQRRGDMLHKDIKCTHRMKAPIVKALLGTFQTRAHTTER